ncbi:P-loop containing nucleoside triphosphate hydrolase protein [Rhodotorula sp. JG-1b]|nr:P-loop containing nucleoside triphosphate hydrolase protein [Rhodotorula sp. JG-1b]
MSDAWTRSVVIKVGMIGDAQIGKTSLMRVSRAPVKYVEGPLDENYIQTLAGVNFMEISLRNTQITFSVWDLGGSREFVTMLPLVCNDAVAILFMFDLSRKSTLNSIKKCLSVSLTTKQEEITRQEQTGQALLVSDEGTVDLCSTSHSINVQKIFKIVLSKAFDLKCTIPEITETGEPLLIYLDNSDAFYIRSAE